VPDQPVSLPLEATLLIPGIEKTMTPDQLRASGDAQLLRALSLLSKEEKKGRKSLATDPEASLRSYI
jgi:hypothetical protein